MVIVWPMLLELLWLLIGRPSAIAEPKGACSRGGIAGCRLGPVPSTLNVLAPIRFGEEARLREVLRPIGDDISGRTLRTAAARPHIDFCRSRRIHFARFAILGDPDRGPERKAPALRVDYDGDLDDHLAELVAITSDMDAIWGRCEATRARRGSSEFIRAHVHEPEAFYIAFRDEPSHDPGADRAPTTGPARWTQRQPRRSRRYSRPVIRRSRLGRRLSTRLHHGRPRDRRRANG